MFDGFNPVRVPGEPDRDCVDPAIIRADLTALVGRVERVREYAERTRAHRTPTQNVNVGDMTFRQIHGAITQIRQVLGKYYALLTTSSIVDWEPTAGYDTVAAYQRVWAPDADRLREALDREARQLEEPLPADDDGEEP